MKERIILPILLCITTLAFSQRYDWRTGFGKGSLFLIPGISAGLHEVLQHRYVQFKERFPAANDNFWDPRISWEEKYKDPYPFSRTFPLFTDAYHLTNGIKTIGLIGCTANMVIGEKKPWWHYALDVGIGSLFYSIGTNVTYEFFNVPRNKNREFALSLGLSAHIFITLQ